MGIKAKKALEDAWSILPIHSAQRHQEVIDRIREALDDPETSLAEGLCLLLHLVDVEKRMAGKKIVPPLK